MENDKKKAYEIRLEVSSDLVSVWEDFRAAIDNFEKTTNVVLHFNYWYDSKKQRRKDLSFVGIIDPSLSKYNKVTFDIRSHIDKPSDIKNCKYYFIYTDSDSFISNVFEMFSFIKAILNHEEQKNDSRNDRKRAFHKKTRNKKVIVDDEESATK